MAINGQDIPMGIPGMNHSGWKEMCHNIASEKDSTYIEAKPYVS